MGGRSSYGSDKLARAGAKGPRLNIDWETSPDGKTLRGVVTTIGGRKFPVEWDEFDIGPRAADQVIDQYAKLLDLYPEVRAVPLALGTDAAVSVFKEVFSDDPYNVGKIRQIHDPSGSKPTGYVINSTITRAPLMMAYTSQIDMGRGLMKSQPENWGKNARTLTNDQAREYIVSHEFGHVVQQQAISQMSPGQQKQLDTKIARQLTISKDREDIGTYGASKEQELFAEAFAMQTHSLQGRDASFLRDVTDPYTGGAPVRTVEWTS